MSLNWNVEDVIDQEGVCWVWDDYDPFEHGAILDWPSHAIRSSINGNRQVRRINPVTQALVFLTIPVDIGKITEANAGEFYARVKIHEALNGMLIYKNGESAGIEIDDVIAHIGLSTNASFKDGSRTAFMSRMLKQTMDHRKGMLNDRLKERETA